jgi:dolichol-phosphate hexosyltransferase
MVSILMPVYNEASTVTDAIAAALAAELSVEREIIVVDDGSSDGTREILERGGWPASVRVLRHERNRGKGAAVRTALAHAGGTFATIFDADLEYRADDLAAVLEPLVEGRASAVFGVRTFQSHTSFSFLYVVGNRVLTLWASILFNAYLSDLMTGHKALRTDLFRSLRLGSRGFEVEPEIAGRLLRRGEPIFEVPVHYAARSREDGKKLTPVDGLRVAAMLVRCRLGR